jgi:hypothetical protein
MESVARGPVHRTLAPMRAHDGDGFRASLARGARALDVTLVLAASKLALHVVTANGYGYFRDELYYLACGEHLDWGYVDHAPLVAWIARAIRVTLGDSRIALRLYPALCGAATVFLAGLVAHRMGGRRFAQAIACAGVIVAPYFLLVDHLFTMNCLDPVLWTLGLLFVVKAETEPRRAWLGFGAVVAVGLLNKHAMLFFGAAVALALLCTPQRRQLLRPLPWIAVGMGALALAPNLVWQARHAWPTLEFMRYTREHSIVHESALGFAKEQLLGMHPLTAPIVLAGLWFTLVSRDGRAWRAVGIVYVALFALFVTMHGKPYYLLGAYPALLGAGGVMLERVVTAAWARAAALVVVFAGGAAFAPIALPVLSVPAFERYASVVGIVPSSGERAEEGPLPQLYADMFGWEPMARKVARAYASLAPEERAVAAVYANDWGQAGAIDFFGPRLVLPHAISGHNSYWIWGYEPFSGEVLIVIGGDAEDHEEVYDDVRRVDETDDPLARSNERGLGIYVCRKPRKTLREIWPRVRHYD